MGKIQFTKQDSNLLDTPMGSKAYLGYDLDGSLFFKTSDSGTSSQLITDRILASYSAGVMTKNTYAEWQLLKAQSELPEGQFILITDKGDTGLVLYCSTTASFAIEGAGGFINGDYNNTDVDMSLSSRYSGIKDITGVTVSYQRGAWNIRLESISVHYYGATTSFVVGQTVEGSDFSNGRITQIISGTGPDTGYLLIHPSSGDFSSAAEILVDSNYLIGVDSFSTYPIANGDIVVDAGYNYQLVDSTYLPGGGQSPGSSPSNAYILLSKTSSNVGYVEEWDTIIYDFDNDVIKWRMDKRGNKINNVSQSTFQFGDDKVYNYTQGTYDSCYVYTINNRGVITGEQKGKYSSVNVSGNIGDVYVSVDGVDNVIYGTDNSGSMTIHVEGYNSGIQCSRNSGWILTYIYDESAVQADDNTGNISGRYSDAANVMHSGNNGQINYCAFEGGIGCHLILDLNHYHNRCIYTQNRNFLVFPSDKSYQEKSMSSESSNFEATIDITGLTTLDITTKYWYCGIINVTSDNTHETINAISKTPIGFPVKIRPSGSNLISLTILHTPISSAGQDSIITFDDNDLELLGNPPDNTLSDFIEVVNDANGNKQVGGKTKTGSSNWLNPNGNTWNIKTISGGTAVSFNGTDPVLWWDSDNYVVGVSGRFRGAIIEYHAMAGNTSVGTIIITSDYTNSTLSHSEATSGDNIYNPDTFWVTIGRADKLYFTASNSRNVMIQYTARLFYGDEYFC